MKVFVTGVAGQLGFDVARELLKRGYEVAGSDLCEESPFVEEDVDSLAGNISYFSLDITNQPAVEAAFLEIKPDVVIHCAAWTAVDAAEEEENSQKVMEVNAMGTANIVVGCDRNDCTLMYISTDYVFNGRGEKPWKPDCRDFHPQNKYGESKLIGEMEVPMALKKFFIVRIAWVFGKHGKNFVRTMLSLAEKNKEIKVVSDQIGTPTYTYDLARLLVDMIETEKYGYYHATNEGGYISWYDFAKEIFKQAYEAGHEECGEDALKVIPVTTEEYGIAKAKRPFNSRLEKEKLVKNGFTPLPDWKDALHRYLVEIGYCEK